MKRIIFFVILFVILTMSGKALAQQDVADNGNPERLFLFYSNSCPHCKHEKEHLLEVKKKYPNLEIVEMEVSGDFKNQNIFDKVLEKYELMGGVPLSFLDDEPIEGFNQKKLDDKIEECSKKTCNNIFINDLLGLGNVGNVNIPDSQEIISKQEIQKEDEKTVTVFGKEICLNTETSTCFLGVVLGLADGINPCMFSVLLFLLTYLMAIGSRKKAIKAGIAFSITTFIVYFIFMLGLIKIIDVLKIAQQIRYVIIFLSFILGIIMIKDFFFYGKGISLEIPAKFKPKLEALTQKGTIISAIVLALLASIVELPCTSGLPLAYISVITSKGLIPYGYLFLYNLFFVIPLMAIIIGVAFTWTKVENVENFRQKTKKYMRLISGILLIVIGFGLLFNFL